MTTCEQDKISFSNEVQKRSICELRLQCGGLENEVNLGVESQGHRT